MKKWSLVSVHEQSNMVNLENFLSDILRNIKILYLDRLTKELLLQRENGIKASDEIEMYKDKVVKLEGEVLLAKMKLSESETEYHRLKKESNNKIR